MHEQFVCRWIRSVFNSQNLKGYPPGTRPFVLYARLAQLRRGSILLGIVSALLAFTLCGCGTYVMPGPAAAASLSLSENSVDFGPVVLGSKVTRTITLSSSGTAPLSVQSATIAGAGFGLAPASLPASLDPGQSLQLQISFNPAQAGPAAGSITLVTNTPTKTVIALNGSAVFPGLQVSASDVAFGNIQVGAISTKSVTLSSVGTSPVTVASIVVNGVGFAISGPTVPVTLAPAQSLAIQITFQPSSAGGASGTITVSSDSSSGSTMAVSLSGNGIAGAGPVLTVTPNSIDFADQSVGSQASLALTLSSTGDAPVTVSSANVTGPAFSISGATFPVTLAPNIAITMSVRFSPQATGTATGRLSISSNSTISPSLSVPLTGIGVQPQHRVNLSWAAPTHSPVPIAGYNVYRAITGTGSYRLLQPSDIPQTSFTDSTVVSATAYTYYATSVDTNGLESSPSAQVSVTIP